MVKTGWKRLVAKNIQTFAKNRASESIWIAWILRKTSYTETAPTQETIYYIILTHVVSFFKIQKLYEF